LQQRIAQRFLDDSEEPATQKRAFNKYNPDDLLAALVDILDKYELEEAVDKVKSITPVVQRAWRDREH
jgi:hypothetical protein